MRLNVQVHKQKEKVRKIMEEYTSKKKGKKTKNYTQVLRQVRPWL